MQDVSEFTKDQLAEYAKKEFNVDLDLRRNLEKLRAEVKRMQTKPVEVKAETVKPTSSHIKNKETGLIFPYTPMLEVHLKDRGVLCDENGVEI